MSNDLKCRDIVFPISLIEKNGNNYCQKDFLGTGFFIGSKGYDLTAQHVVNITLESNQFIMAMFVNPATNKWNVVKIDICDNHPTEDITLLFVENRQYQVYTKVLFEKQFSACTYSLLGYPSANLYEDVDCKDECGRVLGRPDLIYSSGHIRRRISFKLPSIKGSGFYELSQPVGQGCSGSPIFKSIGGVWHIIGVYVADKIESVTYKAYDEDLSWSLRTLEFQGALAYAVRMDSVEDWRPQPLNITLDRFD
ncbi:trypsin-like peptidase domain protein [Francisella philomiragia subsp. philomiragia ATCC 25015]|uniref:S1 family peptidase n=1 Tax=Francisella philomiragia TaxID=28110 RepID=UPI0001AF7AF1|nr:serine protease [Francisella philomiragia]AJI74504.1 trypsin-like peptidase domain protein [Francisella philomiragia subsp. philomiragia ATCC 25015]EET21937.1 predicted protein [Francisella philomiragia subsp. philomiragia ATCC 25015]MBK2238683.1 trypsin-like peptidase domain-containing protein [Francisella philomiragia]